MCGLVAVLGSDAQRLASHGLGRLLHRGVRDRTWVSDCGRAAIAHTRLPIVGLGGEHDQPAHRGPWTIAFVGEVLDFRRWRPDLECDVDLVADEWAASGGPGEFVGRGHDGFWHVVAYHAGTRELHLLVDYLCQKPLYYRADRYAVAAASEPDAVASLGPVTPDEVYLSAAVKWGYCPETWRTPYLEVQRLTPGQHMILNEWGAVHAEYADRLVAAQGDLRRAVEEAVRLRVLSSDVPVAALVSGGLDSAIAYELARRHGEIRVYHAENGEEGAMRRVVGDRPVTMLERIGVAPERALDYMQEPLDLGSLAPQVALSDAIAAAGAERVCLTGDGADELFGGYGRAQRYDSQFSDVFHELVAWHLPRLDRVMMRNCIEVRSPFLARDVVQIALGLPRELRIGKKILRDLFRDMLPDGVADVPKRPLRTPEVERDRLARTQELVDLFRKNRGWHK